MGNETYALETYIAGKYACATNSVQTAVQACLELLGTRTDVVPVIMPVTAPPDTLAGVLRAGGHPLLLDIDEETLQVDVEQLKDAIAMLAEEERVPIGLFNRPFGQPVRPEIIEVVQDLATISDTRLTPHPNLEVDDVPCSFNIFDLTPICGTGAVVIHPFAKQVQQLKEVVRGPMGLSGSLPHLLADKALEEIHLGRDVPFVWFKVDNAKMMIANLHDVGVKGLLGVYPLYHLEEVRRRYMEEPEYPVAKSLENRYVCVAPQDVPEVEKLL